ncbi:hypothetical protein [Halochromatium salexigens]|uniref:hypothetical protein n=1 Tax=Halochromatium salexigens TaxID=49447 RepID=UPI0019126E52|nr:hypothetical protein [Halochromatium salexigens]
MTDEHPNKYIRETIDLAFTKGWRLEKAGPRIMPRIFAGRLRVVRTLRSYKPMANEKKYEFTLILAEVTELSTQIADALFVP